MSNKYNNRLDDRESQEPKHYLTKWRIRQYIIFITTLTVVYSDSYHHIYNQEDQNEEYDSYM